MILALPPIVGVAAHPRAGARTPSLPRRFNEVNDGLWIDWCEAVRLLIDHAGYAIEKLDRQKADERIALFRELAAAWAADKT
jgi:hypothetical protein